MVSTMITNSQVFQMRLMPLPLFYVGTCLLVVLCFGCQKIDAVNSSKTGSGGNGKRTTSVKVTQLDEATTSDVRSVDENGDGKIDLRIERIRRDGAVIFSSLWHRKENTTARSYRYGGRILMTETDADGDNFIELLIFFDDQGNPIEAFRKSKDGAVVPLTKHEMVDVKAAYGYGDIFVKPFIENLRNENIGDKIPQATNEMTR